MSFLDYCGFKIIYIYPNLCRFIQMFGFSILTQIPLCLVNEISILHTFSTYGTVALLYSVVVTIKY
jgi:hypothetical protein